MESYYCKQILTILKMHKTIAVLLNGPIYFDYRVIKMIETLSEFHFIHLYYVNERPREDCGIFTKNVTLFPLEHKINFKVKILRNSFFCYECNFMINSILENGINYDYIWANDLPTLYPAYRIAKKIKAKLIYDSHEIFIETINQFFPRNALGIKGLIFEQLIKIMRWHGKKIEKKLIPECETFITVNESLLDYFKSLHLIKKSIVIMNLPRLSNCEVKIIDYKTIFNWGKEDTILIYQGSFNEGRGLFILLQSIILLPTTYNLVMIGEGALKSELIKFVERNGLQYRVQFIQTVPSKDLSSYTNGADIGINLLETYNLSKKLASPNKLFEYIHAEIPIIATHSIENDRVFHEYLIGRLVQNDPLLIMKSIIELTADDIAAFKENCRNAKIKYNWDSQKNLLYQIIC